MDGFFQHGLYPDWCFISTCCGKTLREKNRFILVVWYCGPLAISWILSGVERHSCLLFSLVSPSSVPLSSTAWTGRWFRIRLTTVNGKRVFALKARCIRVIPFPAKFPLRLLAFCRIMLTQIGYIPNIAQSDTTLLGLRQLIFYGLAVLPLSQH